MAKKRKTGTAVVNWKQELAKQAQAAVEELPEPATSRFISTRGGRYTYAGKEIKAPWRGVILDWALENDYFKNPFNADEIELPDCFAIGKAKSSDALVPSDVSPEKQSLVCASCWANEFGSAETGRGKACKQRVRLAVIHEDQVGSEGRVDVLFLRLPPTRYDNFAAYSAEIARVFQRPLWGVLTEFQMELKNPASDAVATPVLTFGGELSDAQLASVKAVVDAHAGEVEEGYTKEQYELQAQQKKAGGGARGKPRRKVAKKAAKKKAPKR